MKKDIEYFAGYIPVLHDGYIRAFSRYPKATIGIINDEILSNIDYLRKDIRAIKQIDIKKALIGLGRKAEIIDKKRLNQIIKSPIAMPDDDITRTIKNQNPDAKIFLEPIFLRWDRDNSITDSVIVPDSTIDINSNDPVIKCLSNELKKSTNWWRHLGVVITDDDNIIISTHNCCVPTEYSSWIDCDPRITAKKGENIERSIDMHAEARAIAEAANRGLSLKGKNIYVSTFPCPNCAKLIAVSGFSKCYYIEGYSMLDGYDILKSYGIEIIKINIELPKEDPKIFKKYN